MSGSAFAVLMTALLIAYLLGSFPTGFVIAKALKGIDIREHGSGNTGATNVFRVLGKGPGMMALVIDLLKGVAAVLMMRWVLLSGWVDGDDSAWWLVIAALLAVLGHSKSVWLGFSGGKSAATGLGVLFALAWPVGLGVAAVFSVFLAISRTVSVGSIAAALSAGVFMVMTRQPLAYVILAIACGLYVVIRHKSNIQRLLKGTEPKTFGN
ncbi:MAG: glycerol-3-phosphate 1-O-acyltransferase PlsY [Cyanobacteria bacterium P01_D01_bin.105]